MNHPRTREVVLAIYPTTRGFGYIIMCSPLSPVDWGVRDIRAKQKNAACLQKVSALIDVHQPDVIVLEDPTAPGANRSERIKHLCQAIARLADGQSVEVHVCPRSRVSEFFKSFGARTRHEVAIVIASQVTALERFLPARRKIWQSEPRHISIFNATALAMTYFGAEKQ